MCFKSLTATLWVSTVLPDKQAAKRVGDTLQCAKSKDQTFLKSKSNPSSPWGPMSIVTFYCGDQSEVFTLQEFLAQSEDLMPTDHPGLNKDYKDRVLSSRRSVSSKIGSTKTGCLEIAQP